MSVRPAGFQQPEAQSGRGPASDSRLVSEPMSAQHALYPISQKCRGTQTLGTVIPALENG